MRISIVIPNYNSGATLERAILSLIAQHYADLQLIICDSLSTDNSREIIERYRSQFDVILYEKDKGQADALNNGFARANGEVFGWLCSDDELIPGTLAKVAELFAANPDAGIVIGGCERVFADGSVTIVPAPSADAWRLIGVQNTVEQPATFWKASLHRKAEPIDLSLHLGFDWDFWNRLKQHGPRLVTTDQLFARYYFSESNKTSIGGSKVMDEMFRVVRRWGPYRGGLAHVYRFLYRHFDLQGCYDKPPTCTLARSHAFMWALATLRLMIGQELLYKYNWHFASCQERGLKWWY